MAATSDNEELVEELICFPEEYPGNHYSITEFASTVPVSKTSIHHMVKKRGSCIKAFNNSAHDKIFVNKDEWKDQLCLLYNFLKTLYVDLLFQMRKIFHFRLQPVVRIIVFIFLDLKMILILIVCFTKVTNPPKR